MKREALGQEPRQRVVAHTCKEPNDFNIQSDMTGTSQHGKIQNQCPRPCWGIQHTCRFLHMSIHLSPGHKTCKRLRTCETVPLVSGQVWILRKRHHTTHLHPLLSLDLLGHPAHLQEAPHVHSLEPGPQDLQDSPHL